MRVLLDTCIVVDVLQHREPFFEDSYRVMLAIANRRGEGFLTAKSFTDLYYLTHRSIHDDKKTRKILSTLLTTLSLLDTAGIDCRRALSSEAGDYGGCGDDRNRAEGKDELFRNKEPKGLHKIFSSRLHADGISAIGLTR